MLRLAPLCLILLLAAACGGGSSTPTTIESGPPSAEFPETSTSQPPATSSTTLATTSTSSTTTTPATTTTAAPPLTITVGPFANLLGVPLGAPADRAITDLVARLGPPTGDTGWGVGCPLDGEAENERTVTWGSLYADFYRTADGDRFQDWRFHLDPITLEADAGGPGTDQIILPAAIRLGEPIGEAAATLGLELEIDDVFGVAIISGTGFSLWSGPAEEDPIDTVGVPFIPLCD